MAASIKTANENDSAGVINVMTLAFSTDPMARWSLPDPSTYLENFPLLVKAFGGKALAAGTAFLADGCGGAALWLEPGVQPDEETLIGIVERTASDAIKPDLFAVFEQMGKFHPKEPHWYLPMIGVDPAMQGNGLGSALLKHALEICDRDHHFAYLESSNPRNVPLYERHGFKVIGEIQAGSSPMMRPMLREAR